MNLYSVHVIWMLKLIPDLSFYCSHFQFPMMIPLDGLLNVSSGFGQNCKFLFKKNNFAFHLVAYFSLWHTDISWPSSELIKFWSWSVDFPFWHHFDEVEQVKFGVSGNFLQNAWEEWHAIWHVDVSWLPFQLLTFWSWSVDFPHFGRNLNEWKKSYLQFSCIFLRKHRRNWLN